MAHSKSSAEQKHSPLSADKQQNQIFLSPSLGVLKEDKRRGTQMTEMEEEKHIWSNKQNQKDSHTQIEAREAFDN